MTPGLSFAHESGFFFEGTYRYTRFEPAAGAGIGPWDQHEAYATLGFSRPLAGVALHYAFVHDGSGALGASHHVGFTARVSPFGDVELRGSASFYDDMTVLRAEPSWRIPIAGGFSVRPGAAVAWASGAVRGTAMLTLSLDRSLGSLWAGGKYGVETRPVYFAVPVVYDIPESIAYGAWAGWRGECQSRSPHLRIVRDGQADEQPWRVERAHPDRRRVLVVLSGPPSRLSSFVFRPRSSSVVLVLVLDMAKTSTSTSTKTTDEDDRRARKRFDVHGRGDIMSNPTRLGDSRAQRHRLRLRPLLGGDLHRQRDGALRPPGA